ncbi:MAG: hypothetical protein EYC68_13810 [Chloroflexota bacterium]|nr:MAG: hypothetical protein EYC68_13810 [Chloroflexota bacterium]
MRAIVWISIPVIAITALLVFWLSNRSFLGEAAIILGIIAFGLFAFLAIGLFHGVRLEEPIIENPDKPFGSTDFDVGSAVGLDAMPIPDLKLDVPDVGGGGDDIAGCLVSIVLWVVVLIVLAILFWLLVQVLAFVLPWVLLTLYWVFFRALKLIFGKSPMTRGKIVPSLGYALFFTVLYTGWLFVLLGLLQTLRALATS